ncbi:MAG: hypothetical protein RL885_08055 [Planctomycetota bacterium]
MSRPGSEAERLIFAAATGELSEQDERVRRVLAEHPELESRLSELKMLTEHLDQGAAFQDEVLEAAARWTDAPGEDRVEAIVRGELAREPQPVVSRRRGLWIGGALAFAAAILIAIFLPSLLETGPDPGAPEQPLGQFAIQGLEVNGAGSFAWTSRLPRDTTYVLEVASEAEGAEPNPLDRFTGIFETRFEPSEETIAAWPRNIVWRVIGYDGDGLEQGRSDWSSWQRSR